MWPLVGNSINLVWLIRNFNLKFPVSEMAPVLKLWPWPLRLDSWAWPLALGAVAALQLVQNWKKTCTTKDAAKRAVMDVENEYIYIYI